MSGNTSRKCTWKNGSLCARNVVPASGRAPRWNGITFGYTRSSEPSNALGARGLTKWSGTSKSTWWLALQDRHLADSLTNQEMLNNKTLAWLLLGSGCLPDVPVARRELLAAILKFGDIKYLVNIKLTGVTGEVARTPMSITWVLHFAHHKAVSHCHKMWTGCEILSSQQSVFYLITLTVNSGSLLYFSGTCDAAAYWFFDGHVFSSIDIQ